MDPTCATLLDLAARAGGGWSDDLERALDDVETYLGVQLERLEDMEPGGMPETRRAELMRGLEALLEVCGRLRERAPETELRPQIVRAEALLSGGAP